jgi:alpha-L-fucosidase 2
MRFALDVTATSTDGAVKADTSGLEITGASGVTLLVSARTSFNGFDRCPGSQGKNEKKLAQGDLTHATSRSFEELLRRHLDDYRHFFDRVSLTLGAPDSSRADLPTDRRLERYATGAGDPGLEALYFQYGRYLLISSSRTPGAPANLQGIWNKELRPPWSSNYTININTEMNYWPAEECNLPEMTAPLTDLIGELAVTGKRTAWDFYHARGWVAHHNTDIWALSNPVGNLGKGQPVWANWPMGGNWLCWHLWQHYLYTGDKVFLRDTAYPLMKGAAEFCLDWLIRGPGGYWVTAPSMSPENTFLYAPGKSSGVSVASTMDMSIIRGLFSDLIDASAVLGIDRAFRDTLISRRKNLYPFHVGKRGNLQEWYKDWVSTDIHHRHISHLYGLFPGQDISPLTTPVLAAAARRALEIRGDESTGWSLAWKINCWARLLDGDHAHLLVRDLLKITREGDYSYHNGGGCYPNLFDAHPPFQIDGNFGGTSGIAQMLVQSAGDAIYVLPALPGAWATGEVSGLKAVGGFRITELKWEKGKITRLVVRSTLGGNCRIRANQPLETGGAFRLSPAKGPNSNPFYKTEAASFKPVIAAGAALDTVVVPRYYTYDFPTTANHDYVLIGK